MEKLKVSESLKKRLAQEVQEMKDAIKDEAEAHKLDYVAVSIVMINGTFSEVKIDVHKTQKVELHVNHLGSVHEV